MLEHLGEQVAEQLGDHMGPATAVGSSVVLAGLDVAGLLELMPNRMLAGLVIVMFFVISYFVRRDVGRINTTIEANTKAIKDAEKRADERHAQLQREIGECVKHNDSARSFSRVHGKLNRISSRVTVLETKEGMHDSAPPDGDEPDTEEHEPT